MHFHHLDLMISFSYWLVHICYLRFAFAYSSFALFPAGCKRFFQYLLMSFLALIRLEFIHTSKFVFQSYRVTHALKKQKYYLKTFNWIISKDKNRNNRLNLTITAGKVIAKTKKNIKTKSIPIRKESGWETMKEEEISK